MLEYNENMNNTIAFIFASAAEKNPTKILSDYDKKIGSYDTYFLCSTEKEKILKKDVDLDLTKLDKYQVVCPVGAEALKYVCGMTGITKYNGVFIEKKYIPIIHPKLTIFKPQYQDDIHKAFSMIEKVKKGDIESEKFEKYHKVIDTQEEFKVYLETIHKSDKLVVDIETTSLSPRKGAVLGIALSTKSHEGIILNLI